MVRRRLEQTTDMQAHGTTRHTQLVWSSRAPRMHGTWATPCRNTPVLWGHSWGDPAGFQLGVHVLFRPLVLEIKIDGRHCTGVMRDPLPTERHIRNRSCAKHATGRCDGTQRHEQCTSI